MAAKGAARLAQILSKRMHSTAGYHNTVSVEQGVIVAGHKLKMDTLNITIPKDGYEKADGVDVSVGNKVIVSWASGQPVIVAKL